MLTSRLLAGPPTVLLLLSLRLRTGLLPSLLGGSPLLFAVLRRLLTATLALLARGLVPGLLLVLGCWRSTSCSSPLTAGHLATLLLEVSAATSLTLVIPHRALLWSLPALPLAG